MKSNHYAPDDPREWLNGARSNLAKARSRVSPDVYLEDLCFDAQQAAEKALKGVLIKRGVGFPYVHDLGCLLTLAKESGLELPESILDVARLTDYAVESRYPGVSEAVTTEEYESALRLAEEVVAWAARVVEE